MFLTHNLNIVQSKQLNKCIYGKKGEGKKSANEAN